MSYETKSCRACLGGGCYRCHNKGQTRTLLFNRERLRESAELRRKLFADVVPMLPTVRRLQAGRAL